MKIKKAYIKILEFNKQMLDDFWFKCSNRLKPQYFSRISKMGFKETMLFNLNMGKRTLQLELNSFFENILKREETITKQGFIEARQKIDPKAFIDLNEANMNVLYNECDDIELWNGYRLCCS